MRDLTKQPLKIGILGCGDFVTRRLFPALKEVDTVRVVCIQNRNQAKAEEMARRFGVPRAVCQREDLLADPAVEAVHITSPNFLHEEEALACAKAGLPTLCEKPLSLSCESVDRMIEAFASRSIPFFVGHQLRFRPAILKAKELVLAKEFGDLLHFRAYYYSRTNPKGTWRKEKGNGGGALHEIGIHLVDLIHFISGEEIQETCGLSSLYEKGRMVSVQGKLPSGSLVSFECAFDSPYYNGFEIIGTKARLVSSDSLRQMKDSPETLHLIRSDGEKVSLSLPAVDVYKEEYKHFAKAVTQGIVSPIEAKIACANQRVIDAANQTGSLNEGDA